MKKIFVMLCVAFTATLEGYAAPSYKKYDFTPYENYLNKTKTLKARFVQISPKGKKSWGTVYIKRPGKMLIDYDSKKLALIADGKSFIFQDRELNETSKSPLSKTPAGVFLKSNVNFRKDAILAGVSEEGGSIGITLRNKEDPTGGTLTLFFNKKSKTLESWVIIDKMNKRTDVNLKNVQGNIPLSASLFEIQP